MRVLLEPNQDSTVLMYGIGPADVVRDRDDTDPRRRAYDGRPRRLEWWRELADYVR